MKAELRGNPPTVSLQSPSIFPTAAANSRSVSGGALTGCLSNLDGACIEKLLLHCASALEGNDVTLAQQVMWVLNNVASSAGDPNQRLASYFLKALVSKASRLCPTFSTSATAGGEARRTMSVTELAGYVDLIPWHRFGFCASNSAIMKAIQGFSRVHILDFSITHCMQWPTLIDAMAKRAEGPPLLLRISVLSWRPDVPPFLNASIEEVGQRLTNFAKYRDVPFEFNVVEVGYDHLLLTQLINPSTLKLRSDEGLVVNCQNWLRYLPDDDDDDDQTIISSYRDSFLETIKSLSPCVVTVVDEDCDLGGSSRIASRITACFNYMWIPFDALETFLPKNSPQRLDYEADIGHKVENIIGSEGAQRIERLESSTNFWQRMAKSGYASVPFCEETVKEVKTLVLNEHASGWGMKKDEDNMMVLTWKGHNSVYATAWAPLDRHLECYSISDD